MTVFLIWLCLLSVTVVHAFCMAWFSSVIQQSVQLQIQVPQPRRQPGFHIPGRYDG